MVRRKRTVALIAFLKGNSDPKVGMSGCANYDHHYRGCLFADTCSVEEGKRCDYFERVVLPTPPDVGLKQLETMASHVFCCYCHILWIGFFAGDRGGGLRGVLISSSAQPPKLDSFRRGDATLSHIWLRLGGDDIKTVSPKAILEGSVSAKAKIHEKSLYFYNGRSGLVYQQKRFTRA